MFKGEAYRPYRLRYNFIFGGFLCYLGRRFVCWILMGFFINCFMRCRR
ncbi:MAG: hypothetical protein LBH59_10535 [Planctomycetaceae bacterium]|nr:hypothetical protein [Planctomycetaceae bacterium]